MISTIVDDRYEYDNVQKYRFSQQILERLDLERKPHLEMGMKGIRIVAVFAGLWGVSGLLMGVALRALFDVQWITPCTSINLILGLTALLLATRNEQARRHFYEGPDEDEYDVLPLTAILWVLPTTVIFTAFLWWIMAQFMN